MDSYLSPVLASILYRVFELQPDISAHEAALQAKTILTQGDVLGLTEELLTQRLTTASQGYVKRGVINPLWLAEHGLRPHFYLANARPGWLEQLLTSQVAATDGISEYILYGDYDTLIILYGSDAEAERQRTVIENDIYADTLVFSASSTPLLYRQKVEPFTASSDGFTPDDVNAAARDYDEPRYGEARRQLLRDRILLGSVWLEREWSRSRITAFVGISLRGRHPVHPKEMLSALQSQKAINRALVHLFETDSGHPYKYFAKLVCRDQDELDQATSAISFIRFGQVHLDGTTMVVASGVDRLPLFRSPSISLPGELPVLDDVEATAREMMRSIGPGASHQFNALEPPVKLAVLAAYARLEEQGARVHLQGEWKNMVEDAVRQFGSGALSGAGPALDGAVTAATNSVESAVKRAIRLMAEAQFGLDHKKAQQELRLPARDFRRLTLGNVVQAFGLMRQDIRFEAFWPALEQTRIDQLAVFTEERNKWMHAANLELPLAERIGIAADTLIQARAIVAWVTRELIEPLPDTRQEARSALTPRADAEVTIGKASKKRGYGLFISHSSKDKAIARRISEGLRAMGTRVFFDEWSIGPSESIIERISAGIAQHDTLAVLLSPNSASSEWVKRELDAALMAQLGGQDVEVLPLLIETCDIPPLLADIKHIDFRDNFEDAFIELMQYVKRRRQERESSQ